MFTVVAGKVVVAGQGIFFSSSLHFFFSPSLFESPISFLLFKLVEQSISSGCSSVFFFFMAFVDDDSWVIFVDIFSVSCGFTGDSFTGDVFVGVDFLDILFSAAGRDSFDGDFFFFPLVPWVHPSSTFLLGWSSIIIGAVVFSMVVAVIVILMVGEVIVVVVMVVVIF